MRIAAGLAFSVVLACGTGSAVEDASVSGGDATADGGNDGGPDEGSDADAASFPTYNIVDGGGLADGDSSVCRSGLTVTQSCCNGSFCRGFCEGMVDGAVQCSCYGIVEGCGVGQVCCRAFRGCASELVCAPQK